MTGDLPHLDRQPLGPASIRISAPDHDQLRPRPGIGWRDAVLPPGASWIDRPSGSVMSLGGLEIEVWRDDQPGVIFEFPCQTRHGLLHTLSNRLLRQLERSTGARLDLLRIRGDARDEGRFFGERSVRADFDDRVVFVYQAFRASTADEAVRRSRFGEGFRRHRMTWIKPSLGWMLHRSQFATASGQERILRIAITRDGFDEALRASALAIHDALVVGREDRWRQDLRTKPNRVQWDPDRDLRDRPIEGRRAIQIGLGGACVQAYVERWTVSIEDITTLARDLDRARSERRDAPHPFEERAYPVHPDLAKPLGVGEDTSAGE